MIFITKPDRVLSFDETRLELDMTSSSKAKKERTVIDKNEVAPSRAETLAHKGGLVGTGIGGSTSSGKTLCPLFIFGSGGLQPGWCRVVPPHTPLQLFESAGKMLEAHFLANEKGGVKDEVAVQYLRDVVMPCFPDVSATNPIVIICDGHGSHLSLQLIEYARANHVQIALRVPHTSHITQGEDVSNFEVLKSEVRVRKSKMLLSNIQKKQLYRLQNSDFMKIVAPAWDAAFSTQRNLKGWERTGLNPFTRIVMHDLFDEEERKKSTTTVAPLDYSRMDRAQEREDEAEEMDDSALLTGRISSAQLHALGPITGDRAYAIVKGRHDKKQEESDKAKEAKEARAEKARAADAALEAEGKSLLINTELQLRVLTIPKLLAWLFVHDRAKREEHKKLKGRDAVVEAAIYVFRQQQVPAPAPALMAPV